MSGSIFPTTWTVYTQNCTLRAKGAMVFPTRHTMEYLRPALRPWKRNMFWRSMQIQRRRKHQSGPQTTSTLVRFFRRPSKIEVRRAAQKGVSHKTLQVPRPPSFQAFRRCSVILSVLKIVGFNHKPTIHPNRLIPIRSSFRFTQKCQTTRICTTRLPLIDFPIPN